MPPESSPRITDVRPLRAIEGGSVVIHGTGFVVDPLPEITVGGIPARVAMASSRALRILIPPGLDGGRTPIRLGSLPYESVYVDIGSPVATGVHHVDNPVFDAEGNLYVTFSGSRGQQTPVAIFVVRADGSREPFVSGVANPTSMAFDPFGHLHVSSRFDGSVYRISADGIASLVATDLGVACGIAFNSEGELFVGDRSGSILRVHGGRSSLFATLPASIAAFHLAFAPDGALFATAPTLSARDAVYRISTSGDVEVFYDGFGRPQGIAFDREGRLFVVDALAASGGLYRFEAGGREPQQILVAGGLIGVAFAPDGGLAVASSDTVYRFSAASPAFAG